MGDKYLDKLKAMASHKAKFSDEFKQGYKEMRQAVKYPLRKDSDLLECAERRLESFKEEPDETDYRKGTTLKMASELMERGIKNRKLEYSLKGLELYGALGLADRESVKKRFLKAAELNPQEGYLKKGIQILESVNKNDKSQGIEGKVMSGILILSVLGGCFLSPNLTGNVLGNITRSSSNALGLFLVGIIGVFIRSKVK